jgi:hypothetical protein
MEYLKRNNIAFNLLTCLAFLVVCTPSYEFTAIIWYFLLTILTFPENDLPLHNGNYFINSCYNISLIVAFFTLLFNGFSRKYRTKINLYSSLFLYTILITPAYWASWLNRDALFVNSFFIIFNCLSIIGSIGNGKKERI